jgi:hypothetical protein
MHDESSRPSRVDVKLGWSLPGWILYGFCEHYKEAARGHLGAMRAGAREGWKSRRRFYAERRLCRVSLTK